MSVAALQLSNPSLPNRVHVFISLRSKRFRAVSEQRTMNELESQRLQKTENPVPRRSSVFLCSETARKRLLHRLCVYYFRSIQAPLSGYWIAGRIVSDC